MPKKIKYKNRTYYKNFANLNYSYELNDTVKIIEEDKSIEKFSEEDITYYLSDNTNLYPIACKINEIIDKINELRKKD